MAETSKIAMPPCELSKTTLLQTSELPRLSRKQSNGRAKDFLLKRLL